MTRPLLQPVEHVMAQQLCSPQPRLPLRAHVELEEVMPDAQPRPLLQADGSSTLT